MLCVEGSVETGSHYVVRTTHYVVLDILELTMQTRLVSDPPARNKGVSHLT